MCVEFAVGFLVFLPEVFPQGGSPDFKWQGWSIGRNNQNPKIPRATASKRKKKFKNQIPGQKFNPKYPITNFRSNFKKALNDITRKIETLVMESLCLVVIVKTLVTLKNIFCYKHALWTMLLYSRNYAAGISGNYHESSHCFKYPPKKSYLNQATQENICQNFPTPKNPGIENFWPQKILWSFLSLEIRNTPPGVFLRVLQKNPQHFQIPIRPGIYGRRRTTTWICSF